MSEFNLSTCLIFLMVVVCLCVCVCVFVMCILHVEAIAWYKHVNYIGDKEKTSTYFHCFMTSGGCGLWVWFIWLYLDFYHL